MPVLFGVQTLIHRKMEFHFTQPHTMDRSSNSGRTNIGECSELIDSIKKETEPSEKSQVCKECEEFARNLGGKAIRRKRPHCRVIGGNAIA